MKFVPDFDGYKEKVTKAFNDQQFMKLINARLVEIKPGFCEIHLPYRKDLTQQHGFFHAGVISTIADNAAGFASLSLMSRDSTILTVEYKINLVVPGDGELLIGRSNVLKKGRTLVISRSDVFVVKDGHQKLCAAAQLTMIDLQK